LSRASSLAEKLSKLRSQTGQITTSINPASMAPIVDGRTFRAEFERRSVARGAPQKIYNSRLDEAELAALIDGRCVSDGLIVIERRIPINQLHGTASLSVGVEPGLEFFGFAAAKPLFLDTETTGLSGGTGTMVFLNGLAKLSAGYLEFAQCLLTQFQGESAMLEYTAEFARGTNLLVSYNGKSFDLPLLATRYRLAGVQNPFPNFGHFDLLHTSQRAFRRVWTDCTLRSAERQLLGFERVDDVPGSQAPQIWFDWIRTARAGQLPGIIEHNALDVLSMSALVPALHTAYADPNSVAVDYRGIARFLSTKTGDTAAYEFLLKHRDQLDSEASLELARFARRRRHWPVAIDSWKLLAERDHPQAIECLAKYYEHVDRDLTRALRLTERLLLVDSVCEKHAHRRNRLLGKGAA
jgi:uncharacterized protein YprB with RNaseH-like and TPR domain